MLGVAATVFALVSTLQAAAYLEFGGKPIPWFGLLKARLVDSYLYALFVPALYALSAWRPVNRESWPSALPLHLVAGIVCAVAKEALFTLIGNWFRPGVFNLTEILAGDYFDEVLFFWALSAAIHAYLGWARGRPAEAEAATSAPDRFVVSGREGYRIVPLETVEWIDAQGNYAQLNTKDGRHLVRETMASIERRLGDGFIRVHRGAIVNRAHIQRIEPRSHGSYAIILSSGAQIVTSRSYNARLRSLFH